MSGLSVAATVWVVVVYCVATLAQSLSGFGFSLTAIPLLTLVVTTSDAVVGSTLVGLISQGFMAWHLRNETDRSIVRRALPASLIGMPVGLAVGNVVTDRALRISVGVCVLTAVMAMIRGWQVRGNSARVDSVAGLISGVLGTTTGTNGPPLVIALASRGVAPAPARATLSTLFAVGNIGAAALFALDGSITKRAVVLGLLGIVPSATIRWAAEPWFRRLDQHRYRTIVLSLLTAAGVVAIVNAVR